MPDPYTGGYTVPTCGSMALKLIRVGEGLLDDALIHAALAQALNETPQRGCGLQAREIFPEPLADIGGGA